MKNGYSAAPIALSDGLDIRVNTAVKNIKYFPGGVEVTAENLKTNNSTVTYKGESQLLIFNWPLEFAPTLLVSRFVAQNILLLLPHCSLLLSIMVLLLPCKHETAEQPLKSNKAGNREKFLH